MGLIRRDRRLNGASLGIRGWSRLRSRPDATEFRRKRAVILQRVLKESLHSCRMSRRNEGWNKFVNMERKDLNVQNVLTLKGIDGERSI